MTTERRDGNEEQWRAWIRRHPELDSRPTGAALSLTDSDMWFHQYMSKPDRIGTREIQHIMLTEWKTFEAAPPTAQVDSLQVIDAVLRCGDQKTFDFPGSRVPRRYVRSWGVHYVRLSGACPDTSEWIEWDGKRVDVATLLGVLSFKRDPDTLHERSDRRHHAPSVVADESLPLDLPPARR